MRTATPQDIARSFERLRCNKCRRSSAPIKEDGLCPRCSAQVSAAVDTALSVKQAAARFDVSANEVRRLRRRFGISGRQFRRWTVAEHDALVHMRREGIDWVDIGRALERTAKQCLQRWYNTRQNVSVPISKNRTGRAQDS